MHALYIMIRALEDESDIISLARPMCKEWKLKLQHLDCFVKSLGSSSTSSSRSSDVYFISPVDQTLLSFTLGRRVRASFLHTASFSCNILTSYPKFQLVCFLHQASVYMSSFSMVIQETEWNHASCDIYKLMDSGESFNSPCCTYSSINHKYYYYLFCSFAFVRIKCSEQS